MSKDAFGIGAGSAYERLSQLSRQAEGLPAEDRALVKEILEAFSVSVEELQVAAEELRQQNEELSAAHTELEAQRRRYRDLFQFAPDGYLVSDPAAVIQEANQSAVDLLGASQGELAGKPLILYVSREQRDRFHRYLDRLLAGQDAGGRAVEWEMRIQPRRGPAFPAALTVASVRDGKGKLTGLRWLIHDITASKRAEERERLLADVRQQRRLAEDTNRLLQALIETMPTGAIIADADGNLLQTNAAGRSILGATVRGTVESPQRPYTTHYPSGAPLPPADMPLMLVLKEGQVVRDFEMLIRQPDGTERTILSGAAPVLDDSGDIIGGIVVFQDITDLKETQRTLRLQADRLRILHLAGQAILGGESVDEIISAVLPFSRQLAGCVQASVLVFDYQAGEAIVLGVRDHGQRALGPGRRLPLDEYWPIDELARGEISMVSDLSALEVQSPLMEALQAEGLHAVITAPLMNQNELFGALNLSFESAFDLTGESRQAIRQMADQLALGIWQMRLKEELERHAGRLEEMVARRTAALRLSEARFRTIFEDSVLGIALLDPKGEIVASNPALQDMLGYGREELEGTAFTDYGHPDDAEADEDLYQALATGDLSYYQIDKRYVRKDGQVRWSELTVSRVQRARRGEPRRAIAMVADITERKMSQEALFRAERLAVAGRLGASLGHEINNPLQSVIGCLGLAEEILDDGAEVRRYLEIAMEELERAAGIVTQLRDLGREPRAEKAEPTDLNALVEKALLLTRKSCQSAGVEVEWSPANDLSPVPAVPGRLHQVFLNLILNAVAAMPHGGRLHLSTTTTSQPEGVQIRFADTGVGIEPGRLSRIFEPFHSSRPEGLGLGLYISKQIVEEHDGQIEVVSQVGEGTTFTVWLPA